jgi:hypothetical protein
MTTKKVAAIDLFSGSTSLCKLLFEFVLLLFQLMLVRSLLVCCIVDLFSFIFCAVFCIVLFAIHISRLNFVNKVHFQNSGCAIVVPSVEYAPLLSLYCNGVCCC